MSIEYFKNIENYFGQNGLEKPVGCSASEISQLEERVGFELPDAYKAYLKLMGRDYKGVLCGTDCFIDHVIENNEDLPELLEENNVDYELPENYLTFLCHQGYIMAWFALPKESENPTCYIFSEGTTKVPEECGKFTQFITSDIMGNAKLRLELRRQKKWWQVWKR